MANACSESLKPQPGPIATAVADSDASSKRDMAPPPVRPKSSSGNPNTKYDGSYEATTVSTPIGTASRTRPVPDLKAPRPASTAAPLIPRLPAAINAWPNVPLCPDDGRSGRSGRPVSVCMLKFLWIGKPLEQSGRRQNQP